MVGNARGELAEHTTLGTAAAGDREQRGGPNPTHALFGKHGQTLIEVLDEEGTSIGVRRFGEGGSADILGINPNTLRSRMKKLGLGGARDYRSKD